MEENTAANTMPSTITSAELKIFVNSPDFALIVQQNHEKYKKIWFSWAEEGEKIDLQAKVSWNWCAFSFTFFWLLYRKMYSSCAYILAVLLAIVFSEQMLFWFLAGILGLPGFLFGMFGLLMYVTDVWSWAFAGFGFSGLLAFGVFGNVGYLKKCLKLFYVTHGKDGNSAPR